MTKTKLFAAALVATALVGSAFATDKEVTVKGEG